MTSGATVLWARTSIICIVAEVHEEVATPTVTDAPSTHPFCMKDGKSHQKMALKNPWALTVARPQQQEEWPRLDDPQ